MGKLKVYNDKIDPKTIPVRDPMIQMIINGITKAGIHIDRKKQRSRNECRKWKSRNQQQD